MTYYYLRILPALLTLGGAFTCRAPLAPPRAPVATGARFPSVAPDAASSIALGMAPYAPPEDAETVPAASRALLPLPQVGDCVRYFDVDGGRADGQVLVGKIALVQAIRAPPAADDGTDRWLVEINEMEDVGDGYFADYPSRKRRKAALRKLEDVAPLPASFVRGEDAYKVPLERGTQRPLPSHPGYDLLRYEGPMAIPVDQGVVQADGENYEQIKSSLLRNAAIAGAVGTIVAQLLRGTEEAIIYFAGALAGVAYLFFLSIKTDTLGNAEAKISSNVSNLRFVFPLVVLGGVALTNTLSGEASPVSAPGVFTTVTPAQFGAAMIGFLTYRVPLFASQLAPVLSESAADLLPGSVSMAVRLASDAKQRGVDVAALDAALPFDDDLVTVLLVSGPEGTGKSTLVRRLREEDPRFVAPVRMDRMADGANFELREQRGEFLEVDASGRYGLAKEGVLEAAGKHAADGDAEGEGTQRVVVVDASVDLAKRLVTLPEVRLVGVWVGLDDLEKFEARLKEKIATGAVPIPEDDTEAGVLRAKVRRVVKDIEFGVVSGVFEFTILNEDVDDSVRQLKDAAGYCFQSKNAPR